MDSFKILDARARVVILTGVVALCAACAKHDATAPVLDVSLSISGGGLSAAVEVHQTLQLTPTVRDSSGATLTGQSVTWSSSDTTIATVSKSGVVSGRKLGTATITATCDAAQATIALTVVPTVANVSVTFELNGSLAVGGSAMVGAFAHDSSGNTIIGLPVVWSSSDNTLATVATVPTSAYGNGSVTAVSPGTVTISATVGGITGSTPQTVVPLSAIDSIRVGPAKVTYVASSAGFGAGTQLSVFAADAMGNPILAVPVSWSISNPAAAAVSATGLLTPNPAVLTGSMATATVTATVGALSKTVAVVVCPEVASITVSTTTVSLQVGQSVTVTATALDARGNVELAPLSREFVNPNGMVVSPQTPGVNAVLLTGIAAGTSSLDFFDPVSGTKSQTIAITVTP